MVDFQRMGGHAGTDLFERLLGSRADFRLETRIFHALALIMMCGIGLNIPFNLLIGLPSLAWLMTGVLLLTGILYYLSRFRKLTTAAKAIFLAACNIILIANYYYNDGLNGPTYSIFVLCLFLTVAVAPRRQYFIWLPLNLACMAVLFWWDYRHPGAIPAAYTDRASRFTDFAYSYLVISALIAFVTIYMRNAYHQERRAAERRAVDLAAANEIKNKLLSVIAHDLKEPLTSIQGYLELLSAERLPADQRELIEQELLSRTHNASQLLVNVLSWTKSQLAGAEVQLRRINLPNLLAATIDMVRQLAAEKAITVDVDLPADACVIADADMLQLVIRNLLTNAVKFSYPGGRVRLLGTASAANCVISVKDGGTGMSPEQQARIFTLGANSQQGTNSERGSGLGLLLCREFVERQGGHIAFTSEQGHGSTFMISLPNCPQQAVSGKTARQPLNDITAG